MATRNFLEGRWAITTPSEGRPLFLISSLLFSLLVEMACVRLRGCVEPCSEENGTRSRPRSVSAKKGKREGREKSVHEIASDRGLGGGVGGETSANPCQLGCETAGATTLER